LLPETRHAVHSHIFKSRKGATAIEYDLTATLIAVAAITAMTQLGTTFNNVKDAVDQSS
jgi:pilus assembly protein Flp/PilA